MKKKLFRTGLLMMGSLTLGTALLPTITVLANDNIDVENTLDIPQPPTLFENIDTIEQVEQEINNYYLFGSNNSDFQSRAAAGTKWGEGSVVWDGKLGHYVTNYFWVSGKEMTNWNVVGKAQRNAVIKKYGSVNNNTSYKMKTTQHITRSGKYGTSYKTVSAQAWCYGR